MMVENFIVDRLDPIIFKDIKMSELFSELNQFKFMRGQRIAQVLDRNITILIDFPSITNDECHTTIKFNQVFLHRLNEFRFTNNESNIHFIILTKNYATFNNKKSFVGGSELVMQSDHFIRVGDDIEIIKSRNFNPGKIGNTIKILRNYKLNQILK